MNSQKTLVIVAPFVPAAEPLRVIELVGKVITGSAPALTDGGVSTPGSTVTVIDPLEDLPLLSVAASVKTYSPAAVNPVTAVLRLAGDAMVAVAGPESCFHVKPLI